MAVLLIAIVWGGLTLYAVLGGTDFGAGILHLLAHGSRGERERALIAKAIGPVWEANHVWLIFAITGLFSAFPRAFSALGTLVFVPATLAVVAVAVRGAAFAFAGHSDGEPRAGRLFQRLFGAASLAAPLLFGTIAGGLARTAGSSGLGFWIGPFQLAIGLTAVAMCAGLAATFLALEARRVGDWRLASVFRKRGQRAIGAAGALALGALALAANDATGLFHGLTGRALPEVLVALAALGGAYAALVRRQYRLARVAMSFAMVAAMWGWAFAQYPRLVGTHLTVANAAASGPELTAVTVALGAGLAVLVPSLWLLYVAFRRQPVEVPR